MDTNTIKSFIDNVSDKELENIFKNISDYFGLDWLNKDGQNPLQIIWKKNDILAQYELYILGTAISIISKKYLDWLKYTVKKIKSKDLNTVKGHLFELIGLSYFQNNVFQTEPTPKNFPVFDAITKQSFVNINWSFKTFNQSTHQNLFENHCEELYKTLLNIKIAPYNKLTIVFSKYTDNYDDWNDIKSKLKHLSQNGNNNSDNIVKMKNNKGFIKFESCNNQAFSKRCYSKILLAISPYHQNEQKNFEDKLNKACSDINKKAKKETIGNINALFVHLPETVDIDTCIKWSKIYFANNPDASISLILFYQPLITNSGDKFQLTHVYKCVKKDTLKIKPIEINVQIGISSHETPSYKLQNNENFSIELHNSYIFQKGNVYHDVIKNSENVYEGNVGNIADGIIQHSVIFDGEFILSSQISQENNKLLLL